MLSVRKLALLSRAERLKAATKHGQLGGDVVKGELGEPGALNWLLLLLLLHDLLGKVDVLVHIWG